MFTQRHFNHIAWEMANQRPEGLHPDMYDQWHRDITALADLFAETSPNFKRDKFIDACLDWAPTIANGKRVFK